jgi:hypothetical protein
VLTYKNMETKIEREKRKWQDLGSVITAMKLFLLDFYPPFLASDW